MLVSYGSVSIFANSSRALWKWQERKQGGSKDQDSALSDMKEAAWKASALKFPVKGKLFITRISTRADTVGAVLLQRNSGGKWIPVAYELSLWLDQNFLGHEKTWLEVVLQSGLWWSLRLFPSIVQLYPSLWSYMQREEMDISVDILWMETRNEPKVLHTHGSAKFDTPISGMREQIAGKLEKGSCQGAYRLWVEDKPFYQLLSTDSCYLVVEQNNGSIMGRKTMASIWWDTYEENRSSILQA